MSILDNIQNYYESLVLESLNEMTAGQDVDDEFCSDVVCVALNNLPPRYIRHEVDMIYYTSPIDREAIRSKVKKAVEEALVFVREHQR